MSEYAPRRAAVAEGLEERKLDALLVWNSPNLRYLSGFTGSNGALIVSRRGAALVTDPRYAIQASHEVSCPVRIARGAMAESIAAALARLRPRKIGYEQGRLTCEAFEALQAKLPAGANLVRAAGWIERMRMVKSAAEVERIRTAVEIASRAFEQAVRRARIGMTERELAAEIDYRMRRFGAERPSFETIVAAGPRSALPHASPGAGRIERGLVVIDMGAVYQGYASDMTRMLHVGEPPAKTKRLYGAVLEAQLAAIDAVRPGAGSAQVDRAARRVLRRHELDRAFVHSTGHGLGLEIHELPRLGKRDPNRLEPGMAITIEPGVYTERFGGIRTEDTVVVREGPCDVLTPTPKELRVLE
jgi:Xaa-Pro aminopeptidase